MRAVYIGRPRARVVMRIMTTPALGEGSGRPFASLKGDMGPLGASLRKTCWGQGARSGHRQAQDGTQYGAQEPARGGTAAFS